MEYHVLITWNKANIDLETIQSYLPSCLSICRKFKYTWDESLAKENYATFYGEKLEDIQYKVDHCGSGSFLIYIVQDNAPDYSERSTSSGVRTVNANMFDLKAKLRVVTGGGHLVHASDSKVEADLNCMSLFGLSIQEVVEAEEWANTADYYPIDRNLEGATGWADWEALFAAISKITRYVVLRNPETITDDRHDRHGDTDLLVEDYQAAVTIAAAQKEVMGKNRVLYSVNIAGHKQLIDFRYVGDGYYCEAWERNMLESREAYNDSYLWCLDKDNQIYSLLYHALVHKPFFAKDYREMLLSEFGTDDRTTLATALKNYLEEKGYTFSSPKDSSVYIHPDFMDCIHIQLHRRLFNIMKAWKYGRGVYEENNSSNQTLSKMLYRGYYMGITILRKAKSGIKKIINH